MDEKFEEIEKLYAEEIYALHNQGKIYADAHPDIAKYLKIDSLNGASDPYTERLLEGFAYLSGRVKQQLATGNVQFAGSLLDLLYPDFNRDIPSTTILQFKPAQEIKNHITIPRETKFKAKITGSSHLRIPFLTSFTTHVLPLQILDVKYVQQSSKGPSLQIQIQFNSNAIITDSMPSLRLYCHNESAIAASLHNYLAQNVSHACLSSENSHNVIQLSPKEALSFPGFHEDELLLPRNERSLYGFNWLIEYCVFPEKFLFVDLQGIHKAKSILGESRIFTYTLYFTQHNPRAVDFSKSSLRPFCSPAVNLENFAVDPIYNDNTQYEYPIRSSSTANLPVQVHMVTRVAVTKENSTVDALPAFSFKATPSIPTYLVRFENTNAEKRSAFIQINSAITNENTSEDIISIEAYCHNGSTPRDLIQDENTGFYSSDFQDLIINSIIRPSISVQPPNSDTYLETLTLLLGISFNSLIDIKLLKALLHKCNWVHNEGKKRKIDSLLDIKATPIEKQYESSMISGVFIELTIQEQAFQDVNDLYLFGTILHQFFCSQATLNTFVDLQLTLKPSGAKRKLTWKSENTETILGKMYD